MLEIQADQLALIHIPSKLYHQFLRSILQLLVNTENWQENGENPGYSAGYSDQTGDKSQLSFVNVSITPVECSVVCTRWLAQRLFVPEREQLDSASRKQVTISEDDYLVIQVGGEGLDAGQRVVALTHPLAMAGMYVISLLDQDFSCLFVCLFDTLANPEQLHLFHHNLLLRLSLGSAKVVRAG